MKITNTLNFETCPESFTYRITTATVNIFMEHSKNRILEEVKTKRKEILYEIVYFNLIYLSDKFFLHQNFYTPTFFVLSLKVQTLSKYVFSKYET